MNPSKHWDVFVSHASADLDLALDARERLRAFGFRCWLAAREIPAGADYATEIERRLPECRMVLVLMSATAQGSPHVRREIDLAIQAKVPLLWARLDEAPLGPGMRYRLSAVQAHALDRARWRADFAGLHGAIARCLAAAGGGDEEAAVEQSTGRRSRPGAVAFAAGAAGAVAAETVEHSNSVFQEDPPESDDVPHTSTEDGGGESEAGAFDAAATGHSEVEGFTGDEPETHVDDGAFEGSSIDDGYDHGYEGDDG